MKKTKKHYWKGLEELSNDPAFVKYADKEFPHKLPVNGEGPEKDDATPSRRDFLKVMGFSVAAASLAACEAPVRHAIPWLNKPEGIDPGIPNYYASSYVNKGEFASVLVKTREGRPIKIESNHESLLSRGATTAAVQASVLSLYDEFRLKKPVVRGKTATWKSVDNAVITGLDTAQSSGKKIALVSNSIMSPTFKATVDHFISKYANAEWVTYDAIPYYGLLDASEKLGLPRVMPDFLFDKSDVVVGFNVDYLGTWGMPATFTNRFAQKRKLNDKGTSSMSRVYQFEGNLSLTGSNADYRGRMRPSLEGQAVIYLYNKVAAATGNTSLQGGEVKIQYLESAAKDLLNARGRSIVVSSSDDVNIQLLILKINQMLGNINKTLDFKSPLLIKSGNSHAFDTFVDNLKTKAYGAVIFLDANPLYDSPHSKTIASGLKNVDLTVSTALVKDETASQCHVLAPNSHFLESWGDAEPKKGYFSIIQPTINKMFDTRQQDTSLLVWSGNNTSPYAYLKDYWHKNIFPAEVSLMQWEKTLSKGEYIVDSNEEEQMILPNFDLIDTSTAAKNIIDAYKPKDMDIQLYASIGIRDGSDANNPWLQELPDPVTKVTWENYATISQKKASQLGIVQREGNTGMVTIAPLGITVPVLIQPGQEDNTIGIALGYGRKNGGSVAANKGFDMYRYIKHKNNHNPSLLITGVSISSANKEYKLARTQTHQTFMGRDSIIQETTFNEYKVDPGAGTKHVEISTYHGKKEPQVMSMWEGHKYENHHWGLAIDLSACTGCSACVISCQAENNIPVVGKDEVYARRDMQWMRIDRYYSSDAVEDLKSMEIASANPEIVFQPMMCQHCNNAPCETVCPVLATTHSTEGLNQMTYNRCIGTRYCANNCPYKVRRFNWFKYHDNKQFADNTSMNNNLGKMVLNPDVTVRSRGVMEKCSMCVQRIQYGKLEAKKEGRRPVDGEIETACSNSCPSDAIVFGDFNDPKSKISKLLKQKSDEKYSTSVKLGNPRAYHVLEEINVRPNVAYLTKIRNKNKRINKESEA